MSVDITALSIKVESTGIKEASSALGGLSTSAANTEKRISALINTMSRLGTVSGQITQTMGSTAALTAALSALTNVLTNLNQRTAQADQTQRRHNEGMREAHALARGLSGSLGALWLTYGQFSGMATGLAIGASLKGIVTVGKDVEHTLEGIRVRGQETIQSIDEMRQAIFDLGKGVYGPQQVAEAFEVLILAGLKAREALNSVNAAMNLALVGGTSIEKAAATLVSVGSSVGYMAEGFDRVGDVIAKTAALSMASVTTLSEAFKSGSSVAKLYGVSLEDIGTSLGVLSNLGIQGSAAGTALKNFYKELASGSDKVRDTLKVMGLTSQSFKDAKGDYLPLLEVTEKLAKGMDGLAANQRAVALANLTNERGLRLAVQLMGEWNTKTADGSNALKVFRKNVEDSYGFAAIAAVAMSLTAKSQIESMINTLKTTFAEVFTELQPEIIGFTGRMKEIFASQSFKEGLRTIAQGFANLAVAVAENLPLITGVVAAFGAFKIIMAGAAVWSAAAAAITSVAGALRLAATGALTFQAALGPIAILLAAVTAAVVLYNAAQADSDKHAKNAADYSAGYLSGLREEASRLAKVNEQLQKKVDLSTALQNVDRSEARDKMVQNNRLAIAEAEYNLENGIKWTGYTKIEQEKKLAELRKKAKDDLKEALDYETKVKDLAKQNADIVKANAAANREVPDGTGTLDKGPTKATINDTMNKELARLDGEIDAAKRKAAQEKENAQSEYRQGLIGELSMIERIKEAEQNREGNYAEKAAQKIGILRKYANQESAIAQEQAAVKAAWQATQDAEQDAQNKRAEFSTKIIQETQKAQVEAYQKTGQFVLAYLAEDGKKHDLRGKQLQDSYDKSTSSMEMYRIAMLMEANDAAKAAGIKAAANKETEASFNILADATRNAMKGIQTRSEGNGLAAMFNAAKEASARYAADLPNLKAKLNELTDPKAIEEANARLINLAETQRKMWEGVGESISNSLESAFGKGGKAAGDLLKVSIAYANTENKDGKARVKSYGDMASAAKGFFKEGSTGYKVMETAEKAFRLVELAGMAKSLAVSLETSAAKAVGYVPEFMMAWGKLGPWGYAAGAAAVATILGGLGGGGGSAPMSAEQRQKTQGTGSVLGDPSTKSESISKSLSIMEKNSGLGLVQGNSMINYLKIVSEGIQGLAGIVLGRTTSITTGPAISNPTNIFSKIGNSIFGGKKNVDDTGISTSKDSLASILSGGIKASQYADITTKGGWFSSDKHETKLSSLSSDTTDQFSKIVVNMSKSIVEAGKMLGMTGDSFTAKLNSFVVDIGKISLKGMSGDEVQKALEAVFSKLGDDMAKFAISGLVKFQKVGEGYLETVVRIANNLMQVRDVFAVLDKSFTMVGLAAVNVSESLIAAAGGLEKLTEGTKYYVDNFLSDAERLSPITKSLAKRMIELNIADVTSIDLFNKKIRSLDLTNKADQELYAAMLELAPAFKEVTDYADKLKEGTVELTKAQKKLVDAVTTARSNLQKAYDTEKSSLQGVIDKTKTYIQTLKDFQNSLKLGANSPLTNQQKYAEAKRQFDATALAAKAGDAAAQGKFTSIANEFLNASRIINASGQAYTTDFETVLAVTKSLEDAAIGQVDVATASLEALNKQVENLIEINTSVLTVTQAVNELNAAITAGRAGGVSDSGLGIPGATTPTTTQQDILVKAVLDAMAAQAAATAAAAQQSAQQTAAIVNGQNEAAHAGAEVTASTIVAAIGGLPGIRQVVSIK